MIAVEVRQYPKTPVQNALAKRPKWRDREYREAYMEAAIEQGVAWQIKLNRELRGLTQRQLASLLCTHQSAVSRLEDPSYGSHSLETLIGVAKALDCALSVKFISYSQLAYESERLGEAEQCAAPFSLELEDLNEHQEDPVIPSITLERTLDHLRGPTSSGSSRSIHKQSQSGSQ